MAVQRHPLERADRPDRVEVAEQQHRAPRAGDASPKVVAALRLRQHLDVRADLPKHSGEHGAAAIDRRLVRAGGLEPDERLDARDRLGRDALRSIPDSCFIATP